MMKTAELKLTQVWDKTFPQSDKVDHSKVTFINRYGITLAADLYIPKNTEGKLPAIAARIPRSAKMCSSIQDVSFRIRAVSPSATEP